MISLASLYASAAFFTRCTFQNTLTTFIGLRSFFAQVKLILDYLCEAIDLNWKQSFLKKEWMMKSVQSALWMVHSQWLLIYTVVIK